MFSYNTCLDTLNRIRNASQTILIGKDGLIKVGTMLIIGRDGLMKDQTVLIYLERNGGTIMIGKDGWPLMKEQEFYYVIGL